MEQVVARSQDNADLYVGHIVAETMSVHFAVDCKIQPKPLVMHRLFHFLH